MKGPQQKKASATHSRDLFLEGKYDECMTVLGSLQPSNDEDVRIEHNKALCEFHKGNQRNTTRFLKKLSTLSDTKDYTREIVHKNENEKESTTTSLSSSPSPSTSTTTAVFDRSIIDYNEALVLFHLKKYSQCAAILEYLAANSETVDEAVIPLSSFLLIDVYLILGKKQPARKVLASLQKVKNFPSSSNSTSSSSSRGSSSSTPTTNHCFRSSLSYNQTQFRSHFLLYSAKIHLYFNETRECRKCLSRIKVNDNDDLLLSSISFLTANLEFHEKDNKEAKKVLHQFGGVSGTGGENGGGKEKDILPLIPDIRVRNTQFAHLFFNSLGCVYFEERKYHAAAFAFSRALLENEKLVRATEMGKGGGKGGGKQQGEKRGVDMKLDSKSLDKRRTIVYSLGMALLFCGGGEHALACFEESSKDALIASSPLVWLRMGESCLLAYHSQQQEKSCVTSPSGSLPSSPSSSTTTTSPPSFLPPSSIPYSFGDQCNAPRDLKLGENESFQFVQFLKTSPSFLPPNLSPLPSSQDYLSLAIEHFRTAIKIISLSLSSSLPAMATQSEMTPFSPEIAAKAFEKMAYAALCASNYSLAARAATSGLSLTPFNNSNNTNDASRCQSGNPLLRLYGVEAFLNLSKPQDAIQLLTEESIKEAGGGEEGDKGQVGLLVQLAAIHAISNNLNEANACVFKALGVDPASTSAFMMLIYLTLRIGDKRKALELLMYRRNKRHLVG